MKRSYIYVLVIVLTIALVSADYLMGKDLQKITGDEQYKAVDSKRPEVKLATVSGIISIKNEQNSDESIIYDYKLTIEGLEGAYRYKSNDVEGFLIFTANGQATFKLKSNESIEIYEIPVDSDFAIEQETTRDDYITKVNQREGNTFSSKIDEDNSIVFNNAPKHDTKEPEKEEPKEEEKPTSEEPKEEEPKETKPTDPKDIPNTGSREGLTLIILISVIVVGFIFKWIRVKKYE